MGSIKIPIETSARHIHISREDFEKLFGEGKELTFVKELSQPGQYLAKERVTIAGPRGTFENVAILGPFRKETQVELSLTDTRKIGFVRIYVHGQMIIPANSYNNVSIDQCTIKALCNHENFFVVL